MTTYLQLCQDVARDSGTIPDLSSPATVTGQTGRLQRIVTWVNEAWRQVQTDRDDWRWMEGEFSGSTSASTQRYTAAALGISSRFSQWGGTPTLPTHPFSIYDPALGVTKAGLLTYLPWSNFYNEFIITGTDENKPVYFTISPANELVFYPIPDQAYTIRGFYRKSPQVLSADGDEPEMPAEFHDLIKWMALVMLGTFDEAAEQQPFWMKMEQQFYNRLVNHQTPTVLRSQPLA